MAFISAPVRLRFEVIDWVSANSDATPSGSSPNMEVSMSDILVGSNDESNSPNTTVLMGAPLYLASSSGFMLGAGLVILLVVEWNVTCPGDGGCVGEGI